MKVKLAVAAFTAVLAVNSAFAVTNPATTPAPGTKTRSAVAVDNPKVQEMKAILSKLVRQNNFLDEAIETLTASKGNLSVHAISAMGLSIKIIKGNLDIISSMTTEQFAGIQPSSGLTLYTRTILGYSRSISRKIRELNGLVEEASLNDKRPAMRDAVSSGKSVKSVNGKTLTLILEERKAMEMLSSDIQILKASSRKLNATTKWLYIVSK